MRGELIGVWPEMWRQVWRKLASHRDAPEDLFCELYRDLEPAFVRRLDAATVLAAIVDDGRQSRIAFRTTKAEALRGELALIAFLERVHRTLSDMGGDPLTNRYFLLVEQFIEKYNLRYDLRRPFSLHPTLPGMFARLVRELRVATSQEAALSTIMREFEEAVRDLRDDQSSGRIKTCIHKQMNLLEAIAQRCPGVTADTLGGMCDQVRTWPHVTVREAMKKLYGFASNYPGIRHAGNAGSALREIDLRDMVALSVMLAGFAPYLSDRLDSADIYRGGRP